MNILLVGCTGFFGKGLIYYLLNNTKHNVIIALRPKNKLSIKERVKKILNELNLEYDKERIKIIKVEYDNLRNIIMSDENSEYLKKNIDVLLNGLADINFNRPLKKAVMNNTVTALNWLDFSKSCEKVKRYIYISTAFVNFHIEDTNRIKEKIYEKNMSDKTLTDILNDKIICIKPYYNTYLYSKQLTEILLLKRKDNIKLSIFRPSVITPAIKYPYSGWTELQTYSFQIFAIGIGIFPCWDASRNCINHNNINIIPVDIAAKDCIIMIEDKENIKIKHSCFTGNNNYSMSFSDIYKIYNEAYDYYKNNPISINNKKYVPYFPFCTKDNTYLYIVILIIYYLIDRFKERKGINSFLKELILSYKITTESSKFMIFFISKKKIFERNSDDKWFNIDYNQILSWRNFIKNINTIIKNDIRLINL
jgi:thioester reductase-like protein